MPYGGNTGLNPEPSGSVDYDQDFEADDGQLDIVLGLDNESVSNFLNREDGSSQSVTVSTDCGVHSLIKKTAELNLAVFSCSIWSRFPIIRLTKQREMKHQST